MARRVVSGSVPGTRCVFVSGSVPGTHNASRHSSDCFRRCGDATGSISFSSLFLPLPTFFFFLAGAEMQPAVFLFRLPCPLSGIARLFFFFFLSIPCSLPLLGIVYIVCVCARSCTFAFSLFLFAPLPTFSDREISSVCVCMRASLIFVFCVWAQKHRQTLVRL